MSANISNLSDAVLYVDAATYVGEVSGFTPPSFAEEQITNDGIGYTFTPSLPSGRKEEMEATITLNAPTFEGISLGVDQKTGRSFVLKGNLQTLQNGGVVSEVPVSYKMTGRVKSADIGDLQAKDKASPELTITLDAMTIEIDGAIVLQFDGPAGTYIVNGEDLNAVRNSNLGR